MKSPARTAGEYGPRGVGLPEGDKRSIINRSSSYAAAVSALGCPRPWPCGFASRVSVWPAEDWAPTTKADPRHKVAAPLPLPRVAAEPGAPVERADKTRPRDRQPDPSPRRAGRAPPACPE